MENEILTINHQIEKLKEKRLIIRDVEKSKEILKHFSFVDIIEVYKDLFLENEFFKENVTIEQIFLFYHYDRSFQSILFKYTVYVERTFKNKLASIICENIGVTKDKYLDIENFVVRNNGEKILQKILQKIDTKNEDENPYILLKDVSFSNTTSLYDFFVEKIKEQVIFFNFFENEKLKAKELFRNSLIMIRKFRNEIAHSMNFVNYKSERYIIFSYLKKLLYENGYGKLTHRNDYSKNKRGGNDIFAMILVIVLLLDSDFLRIEMLKELGMFLENEDKNKFKDYAKLTNLPENFLERIKKVLEFKLKGEV